MKKKLLLLALLSFCSFLLFAEGEKTKPDERVIKLLGNLKINYTVNDSGNCAVTYDLGKNRSQLVTIMSKTDSYLDTEVREIWSIAGTYSEMPEAAELSSLMEENATNKIGSWCLEKNTDGYLLFYSIKVPLTVSDKNFEDLMDFAATVTDEQEKKFSEKDEN